MTCKCLYQTRGRVLEAIVKPFFQYGQQNVTFVSLPKCEFHAENYWNYCEKGEKSEVEGNVNICYSLSLLFEFATHPPTSYLYPWRESYVCFCPLCLSYELCLHHLNKMLTLVSPNICVPRISISARGLILIRGYLRHFFMSQLLRACLCLHHLNKMLTLVSGKPINITVCLDAGHTHDR